MKNNLLLLQYKNYGEKNREFCMVYWYEFLSLFHLHLEFPHLLMLEIIQINGIIWAVIFLCFSIITSPFLKVATATSFPKSVNLSSFSSLFAGASLLSSSSSSFSSPSSEWSLEGPEEALDVTQFVELAIILSLTKPVYQNPSKPKHRFGTIFVHKRKLPIHLQQNLATCWYRVTPPELLHVKRPHTVLLDSLKGPGTLLHAWSEPMVKISNPYPSAYMCTTLYSFVIGLNPRSTTSNSVPVFTTGRAIGKG